MVKKVILSIFIFLLTACADNKNEIKLVVLDEYGNKEEAKSVICTDVECNEGNEKYFEVIKIKFEDTDFTEEELSIIYHKFHKQMNTYEGTEYIENSIENLRYYVVQSFIWVGWNQGMLDLYFTRYSTESNGNIVSKGDEEWKELKKIIEEMSKDDDMTFTYTIEINIPESNLKEGKN